MAGPVIMDEINLNVNEPVRQMHPLMPATEEKPASEEKPAMEKKPATKKKPSLNQKLFIWDNVIYVLASIIFGLGASSIIVEFFNPHKFTLACFSPFEGRAQYTYVNSYCYKYIPVEEYFAVALMLHVAVLVVPHYLWNVFFSAKIDCFFRLVSQLEILRDRQTGKYPRKNDYTVQYLKRQFSNKKTILWSYITKLVSQFILILISGAVNGYVFGGIDSNITFECYDDNEISQLFGNVTCAYPRKLFINVLQVADYCLLAVGIIMIIIGLFWIFLYNHSIEDEKIAKFCYESGIDPKYYYSKPVKKRLGWYQMKDDFMFLLSILLATDYGFRKVFEAILIEDTIFQKFVTELAAYKGNLICVILMSQLSIIIINCRNWSSLCKYKGNYCCT